MRVVESLLIGEYKIVQDTELYRFTSDAVLLSRAVKAKKKEQVADFCAGSGVVGLQFFAENTGVERVVLFEADPALFEMSKETIALNKLGSVFSAENVRLQEIPAKYNEAFSLILCNPPYEKSGCGFSRERGPACGKELDLSLQELCSAAKKCLKFGGRFVLIHRADRLSEAIYTLHGHGLEPKRVQFVCGKRGKSPYAVLLTAVKGGNAGTELLPPIYNEETL